MTAQQAAAKFGKSVSTIYRWIKKGLLQAIKVARRWMIALTEENMKKLTTNFYGETIGYEVGSDGFVTAIYDKQMAETGLSLDAFKAFLAETEDDPFGFAGFGDGSLSFDRAECKALLAL